MRGGSSQPPPCSGACATPGSWHVLPRAATDELDARGHRPDCQASPAGVALAGYLTASGSGGASWLFGRQSLVGRPGLSPLRPALRLVFFGDLVADRDRGGLRPGSGRPLKRGKPWSKPSVLHEAAMLHPSNAHTIL